MDLKTNQPEFYDFLNKKLVYSSVVVGEYRQRQMYEDYQQQALASGLKPVDFGRIVFLSSGMSYRDDDMDFSPSDVKNEAGYVWDYLRKNPELGLDTVVLSIGFDPTLYVEGAPAEKTPKQNDGIGK